jgi:hypothetical protein
MYIYTSPIPPRAKPLSIEFGRGFVFIFFQNGNNAFCMMIPWKKAMYPSLRRASALMDLKGPQEKAKFYEVSSNVSQCFMKLGPGESLNYDVLS